MMENLTNELDRFLTYLHVEKNASELTIQHYRLDIERFIAFLKKENIRTFSEVDHHVIRLFLTDLHKEKLSRKSVSRIISCLRSFYKLMERENVIRQNPFIHIHLP